MILYCLFLCSCLWGPHAQHTALDLDSTLALTWEGHTKGQDVAVAGTAMIRDTMYVYKSHMIRCIAHYSIACVFFILPRISEQILHACILYTTMLRRCELKQLS